MKTITEILTEYYSQQDFPNYEYFACSSKAFGLKLEDYFAFKLGLTKGTDQFHDLKLGDLKLESKGVRALDKNSEHWLLPEKAVSLGVKAKFDQNIQQVKSDHFDFLLVAVVYKDGVETYIFPKHIFYYKGDPKPIDGIYLSGQHKGNKREGQFTLTNKKNRQICSKYKVNLDNIDDVKVFFEGLAN